MSAPPEAPAAALFPALSAIEAARDRIAGLVRRTPLERSPWLSDLAGCDVHLKLECWQPTRSFKVRGAANALSVHRDAASARGVVTASAGNHGQAVALAARALGVRATVFVPRTAPQVKRDRMRALGAHVNDSSPDYDAAERAAGEHAAQTGALLLHAFSDPHVVAGQGTVALEVLEDLPEVREWIVPVGGGGLINGIGSALRGRRSGGRLLGVQSERTPNLHAALAAGRLVDCPIVPTLADGLAGCTDEPSLKAAGELVDELVLVREASIARAMCEHLRVDGVLAEGSAAVAAAALIEGRFALTGPAVLIITGGNVDPAVLSSVLGDSEWQAT